jgi:hypothetical protein
MEVHHHAHPSPKKWTHYFWEFLMLFLAVFCGFLAENLREHKVERERGKQYAISLYQDLKTDTANFSRLIAIDNRKVAALSNVYECFDNLPANANSSSCLVDLIRYSGSFIKLVYTDRTLQQLKNAGGMRMLNKTVSDSIYVYDNRLRTYLGYETTLLQERQTNLRNSYNELLSFKGIKFLRMPSDSIPNTGDQLLLITDKISINKLFNELYQYAESIKRRLSFLIDIYNNATRLLTFISVKYHL